MKRLRLSGLTIVALILPHCLSANAESIQVYTLVAPPLTMEGPDKYGIDGDILLEAMRRSGLEAHLNFLPWRRSQKVVATGENLLIVPFSRTPERENEFSWVAPIIDLKRTFATLDRPIDSIKQAKAEGRVILVGMGSAQEALLVANGIDNAHRKEQLIGVSEIAMLKQGHVDTWFNSTIETVWKWKQSGETKPLIIGQVISSDTSYVACSKVCAPRIIVPIQQAIAAMRADGTIRRIVDSYLAN